MHHPQPGLVDMAALASTLKRLLNRPRLRRRSARGHFSLARTEAELSRAAVLLAHDGGRPESLLHDLLRDLWDLDTTALYVQIDGLLTAGELVLTPCSGDRVIAAARGFRAETQTDETVPNGAYLVERQYRKLGFYERPPVDRVVVLLRIEAGTGPVYLVDVPSYVSCATVVVNDRIIAAAARLPVRGDLRYHLRTAQY